MPDADSSAELTWLIEAAEFEESFWLVSISLRSGGISRLVRFQSAKVIFSLE